VTVFFAAARRRSIGSRQRKIDRLMPIVVETEQIPNRRNSPFQHYGLSAIWFNRQPLRFVADSALEEAGFEPLVPLTLKARCLTLNLNRARR
jgi:hypothetical protein